MLQPVVYFTLLFSAATGKGSTTMPWLVVTMIGIVIFPIGVLAGCKWIFKHFSSIPFFPPFQFSSALWMLCSASTSGSWSSRSGLLLAVQYNCNDADCEAESLLSALSQFAKVWWYILYYFLKRFQTFMCDDTTSTLFLKIFQTRSEIQANGVAVWGVSEDHLASFKLQLIDNEMFGSKVLMIWNKTLIIRPESNQWQCLSLTDSLPFNKLDWCDPGVWWCLLNTCWGYHCCWC